jgi:hypothetical protein
VSFWRSTHALPGWQSVKPDAAQLAAQVPSLHTGVEPVHIVPHPPQLRLSESSFTHRPTPPLKPAHCV